MNCGFFENNELKIIKEFNVLIKYLEEKNYITISLFKAAGKIGLKNDLPIIHKVEKQLNIIFIYNPDVPIFEQINNVKKLVSF